jgi:hypothetical protein
MDGEPRRTHPNATAAIVGYRAVKYPAFKVFVINYPAVGSSTDDISRGELDAVQPK